MSDQNAPVEEPIAKRAAAALRAMADRLDLNHPDDFSGVFVVIPPEGSGCEMLILDARKDSASFWTLLGSHCQIAIDELSEGPSRATVKNTQMFLGRGR